jgi:soluble lytic murein transglycosylase-like protein
MSRAAVHCSTLAACFLVALAQPAAAAWPSDAGFRRPAAHAPSGFLSRHRRARAATRVSERRPAQAAAYEAMVAQYAAANGVPASLVHRVIMRESRYNERAVSAGNYGLMQIRLGTARAMGYRGSASGLLDPVTNLTYAVRYLAGAYRAARGNEARAISLYTSGYR